MSRKPVAFVLVPGSFAPAHWYDTLASKLRSSGHEVLTPPLLSADKGPKARNPPATMSEDAAEIRKSILSLLDQDHDVIVGVCSYGGVPGGEACKGLSRVSRPNQSAVVGIVYLASFLPLLGESLRDIQGPYMQEPFLSGLPGQYLPMPEGMGPYVFNDVTDPKLVDKYMSEFLEHSSDSYSGKVTYEAWKEIPGWAIVPEKDIVVQVQLQDTMIDRAKSRGGKIEKRVVEGAGHCVFLTKEDECLKVLLKAAKAGGN